MNNIRSIRRLEINPSTMSRVFVVVFAFCVLFLPDFLFKGKILWYYSIPLNLSLVWLVYLVFDFGEEIRLDNKILKQGKYHRLTKSFKTINQIKTSEIIRLDLVQNDKRYYEIVAFSEKDKIVIKKIPNKIPAQDELEKIKTIINNTN